MSGGFFCSIMALHRGVAPDPRLIPLVKNLPEQKVFSMLLMARVRSSYQDEFCPPYAIHIQYALPSRKGVVISANHFLQTEVRFGFEVLSQYR